MASSSIRNQRQSVSSAIVPVYGSENDAHAGKLGASRTIQVVHAAIEDLEGRGGLIGHDCAERVSGASLRASENRGIDFTMMTRLKHTLESEVTILLHRASGILAIFGGANANSRT